MQIDIYALPWEPIKGFYDERKLADEEFQVSEEYYNLFENPSFSELVGDSYNQYHDFYTETLLLSKAEFPGRDEFVEFTLALVNEEIESDLLAIDEQVECFMAVISPERVVRLEQLSALVSENDIRTARESADGDDTEFSADSYLEYFHSLAQFVRAAAAEGRCLLIFMG